MLRSLIPFAGAALIPLFHRLPNLRETVTLLTALGLFLTVLGLTRPDARRRAGRKRSIIEVVPGLALAFKVEPLGMLFALVASALWIVTSIYSIGYMRGNDEPRQTSYYVCFAVALGSTIGIAFAKNLFTLFLFYELLTLSTYPLVTHKANAEAIRAGRIYLVMLLGTSMVLLLPAIVATWVVAGTVDFTPGGILEGKASGWVIGVLLALYVFGIGKAALMPLHFWLPAAMVAPTPVSALLHAVAVVKAGVFTIVKVIVYVFGVEALRTSGQASWLVYVAGATVILASLVALRQDNLKKLLAYSTVSQLSYVVLAAAILTPISVVGAALHIAAHAVSKITLFFAAGSIYTAAHKTEVSELKGIGRRMPWTMGGVRHRGAQHDRLAADGRLPRQVVHADRGHGDRPMGGRRSHHLEHATQCGVFPSHRGHRVLPRAGRQPARRRSRARRSALADRARTDRDRHRHDWAVLAARGASGPLELDAGEVKHGRTR